RMASKLSCPVLPSVITDTATRRTNSRFVVDGHAYVQVTELTPGSVPARVTGAGPAAQQGEVSLLAPVRGSFGHIEPLDAVEVARVAGGRPVPQGTLRGGLRGAACRTKRQCQP